MGPIVIELFGEPPAHKNEKMPVRRKSGRLGLITKPMASLKKDRLQIQIPAEYRNLKLVHPRVEMQFYVMREDFDRSNGWCVIEDLLWQTGVIVDDCVKYFNGPLAMPGAVLCDEWKTIVTITPKERPDPDA